MPRVNKNSTVRYRVRATIPQGNGLWELKEWTAASLAHIRELHPELEKYPVHHLKNICKYQQPDGSWKARSKTNRVQPTVFVERLGFTQIPGQPLRRRKAPPQSECPDCPE